MGLSKNAVIVVIALLGAVASPFATAAEADKAPGSGPNPYRDCGIGAALFSETGWAAVTSNVIWDIGITAITSATASPETCSGKSVKVAQFIIDTYDTVIDETAVGKGGHLTAMLEVYGCNAAVHDDIIAAMRPQVAGQISAAGYSQLSLTDKAAAYYSIVNQQVEGHFAAACSV